MELRNTKHLLEVAFFTLTLEINTAKSKGNTANNMYDVSMCKGKNFIATSPIIKTDMETTKRMKHFKDIFSHSP